jgi:hypothetical protein
VHNLDKDQTGFPTVTCAATDGTTAQACGCRDAARHGDPHPQDQSGWQRGRVDHRADRAAEADMSPMNLWRRVRGRVTGEGDDRGAALVYAMLFITVVSVGIAAVVSLASANLRATTAVRDQANQVAAAEDAAQLAIDKLRHSTWAGVGDCLGTNNVIEFQNFYQAATGPADSASVRCGSTPTTPSAPLPTSGRGLAW